ncbi:MAG: ACP S-malonyltransferase [Acidimicrobiales bacterium]
MLAFTFPGQGSQRPGTGRAWVDHPSWEVVGEASEVAGRDVAHLLLDAGADELALTANAQLATFVSSLVVLDAIERVGLAPTLCAGHSLGEYTALVASGVLGFDDAVHLVVERGEAMHHASLDCPGTMLALIGITDDAAEAACERAEGEAWVANYNAPGQVVIAGEAGALERAGIFAKEMGARKVLPIPVSGAFHTTLMAAARPRLRKALASARFLPGEVPVVANVDAREHGDPAEWPSLLSAQLCSPVRWRQSLGTLAELGATCVVEVGPGGVLTGLVRRVLPDVHALAVSSPDSIDSLVDAVAGGGPWHSYAGLHQGEHLYASERVVVSPAAGVFKTRSDLQAPAPGARIVQSGFGDSESGFGGSTVEGPRRGGGEGTAPVKVFVGDVVGMVGDIEVRTPFEGHLVGYMAHCGERVVAGQPLAWLRVGNPSTH